MYYFVDIRDSLCGPKSIEKKTINSKPAKAWKIFI